MPFERCRLIAEGVVTSLLVTLTLLVTVNGAFGRPGEASQKSMSWRSSPSRWGIVR